MVFSLSNFWWCQPWPPTLTLFLLHSLNSIPLTHFLSLNNPPPPPTPGRIIPRLCRFVPGAPDGSSVIAVLLNSRKKNKIFTCSLFLHCGLNRNGNKGFYNSHPSLKLFLEISGLGVGGLVIVLERNVDVTDMTHITAAQNHHQQSASLSLTYLVYLQGHKLF